MRAACIFLVLAVAACSGPGPWQKRGTSVDEMAIDLAACHQEAQAEADRLYVFSFPFPYPLGWNGGRQVGYLEWQQRFESFKSYEESRLAALCMNDKGYRQAGKS